MIRADAIWSHRAGRIRCFSVMAGRGYEPGTSVTLWTRQVGDISRKERNWLNYSHRLCQRGLGRRRAQGRSAPLARWPAALLDRGGPRPRHGQAGTKKQPVQPNKEIVVSRDV
jgi:hypothetical protein